MKNKFILSILLLLTCFTSVGQVVSKTIRFTSIDVATGSCYINNEGGNEDPAIVIDCASGDRLFASEWGINIVSAGNYTLPIAWSACSTGSSFVIDPVNSTLVSTINVTVQTMEGDDQDCNNDAGGPDDCINSATFLLDISAGLHSFIIAEITYNYTVSELISVSTGMQCGLSLPIRLVDFKVKALNFNSVEISWQTATELNNNYFTIEKSENALDWDELTKIVGNGNSSSLINYSSHDYHPYNGISYYRLKQTDFDGNYTYSKIKSVQFNRENQINAYPNPANNKITITGFKLDLVGLTIYNTFGQNVTELTKQFLANSTELVLDLSLLKPGIYYVRTRTAATKIYRL